MHFLDKVVLLKVFFKFFVDTLGISHHKNAEDFPPTHPYLFTDISLPFPVAKLGICIYLALMVLEHSILCVYYALYINLD